MTHGRLPTSLLAACALASVAACSVDGPARFIPGADAAPDVSPDISLDAPDVALDAPDASLDAPVAFEAPPPLDVAAPDAAVDGADACAPPGDVPYASHVTDEEFTDPPACAACPRTFSGALAPGTALPPGATTLRVEGSAPGARECDWYVFGGSCGVSHGRASVDPDGAGLFTTTVPVFCGTNVVQVVCGNDAGRRVLVRRVEGTRCEGDGRDLRVTLSWDARSNDMELHLLRAAGQLNEPTNDCTWFTCMGGVGLDWGVAGDARDNPMKDLDNTGPLGPENIFLGRAPEGTYHVLVEYWGSGDPSTSDVDVTIRERTVARLHRTMIPIHAVWYVGTVSFPSATFTPRDTITPCASSWMARTRGCDLPLP
ncbi:MAG: hypothetical protein U0324_24720 [Polyangiales bacterium]